MCDNSRMPDSPRIGTEFAGYRIEALLGRGGMSIVYRAENPRLGNQVALKLLAAELEEEETFRERFVRESRLAASINHANVLPIYDAGAHEHVLYIAMKYVAGWDLRAVIRERGALPPDVAVEVVSQVGRGLDAAHQRDLVHRDVKPANILIEKAADNALGHVYLADFGLMKHSLSHSGLTNTGTFLGTVAYISPEQISDARVDGRSDIYSLGCVFYELLTGRPPFVADTDWSVLNAHMNDSPVAPSAITSAPPALDDVVLRAIAKDPDERFQTCEELAAAARAALAGRPVALPPTRVVEPSATGVRTAATPDPDATQRPPAAPVQPPAPPATAPLRTPAVFAAQRSRRAGIVGGVVIAVLALALGYLLAGRGSGSSASPPPSTGMNSGSNGGTMSLRELVDQVPYLSPCKGQMTITCSTPGQVPKSSSLNTGLPGGPVHARSASFKSESQLALTSQAFPDARRRADAQSGTCWYGSGQWDHYDYWWHGTNEHVHQGAADPDASGMDADGQVLCTRTPDGGYEIVWAQNASPANPAFLGTVIADSRKDAALYWFWIHHQIGM
jgi:serine/threonine protein kinase